MPVLINLFQSSLTFQIETSHLVCAANQMSGFYMKNKAGLNGFMLKQGQTKLARNSLITEVKL